MVGGWGEGGGGHTHLTSEIEKGVRLHQVVLNGGACQDDANVDRHRHQRFVDLCIRILDLVTLEHKAAVAKTHMWVPYDPRRSPSPYQRPM